MCRERQGGGMAGGIGRGLNDFTALSLCPAASSFLSRRDAEDEKWISSFFLVFCRVLKHIQMCAALFLYNTPTRAKREREKDFFFFFIYSSLFFKGTRLKVALEGKLCVCVCVWSFELRLLVTADDDVEKAAPARH